MKIKKFIFVLLPILAFIFVGCTDWFESDTDDADVIDLDQDVVFEMDETEFEDDMVFEEEPFDDDFEDEDMDIYEEDGL